MSGFWDEVNKDVSALFSKGNTGSESGFPEASDFGIDPTDNISPDAVKEALRLSGYRAPNGPNPYEVDQGSVFSNITNRQSPFTVIDLNPILDGGTKLDNTATGQTVIPNTFPASQATLQSLSLLLNVPLLSLFKNPAFVSGGSPPGLTYAFEITGNSLRSERLQQGVYPLTTTGGAGGIPTIKTGLIANDVYVQTRLNMLLTGAFVQFDSPDNPVFVLRHGETIHATFNKIYVTTFGSAGRWRIIAGNNSTISGIADDRQLRQNLHLWDANGILDHINVHPIPFSYDSGGSAFMFSNIDQGNNLTQQPSGNLIGTVINQGYFIAWITEITVVLAGVGPGVFLQKYRGKTGTAIPVKEYFSFVAPAGTVQSFVFGTPIRVVLGGFDVISPSSGAPFISGEGLFWVINGAGSRVWARGYSLGSINAFNSAPAGALIPFNPYPGDVGIPAS